MMRRYTRRSDWGCLPGRILPVAVLLVAHAGFSAGAAAGASPKERLILGFEKDELAASQCVGREVKAGRDCWFYLLDQPEGFDFAARFEWPGGTNRLWTWKCRPGEHTEGSLALVASVGGANPFNVKPTFHETEWLSYFYPAMRSKFGAHQLMTTFAWSAKGRPDLWDWTGYDYLRVDVRCEKQAAKIWLALEDNVIEPPVVRTYEVAPSKWLTLELNLREAVEDRELDLSNIRNFWLLGCTLVRSRPIEVRVDNIRIAKTGSPAPEAILRDESPMEVSVARPERPMTPPLPSEPKPDRSPFTLGEPITVAKGSIVPFGWVAAYDNKHIFVAYNIDNKTTKATVTSDGGSTWTEVPAATARNLDHGTARGCAIDANGDGIAVSTGPGCCGFHPSSKQHLTKYTFTGSGWVARLPARILDSDIRHCGHNASVVRLRSGPYKGRLWASWGEIGREHSIGVHVKFSDDDGETWSTWGKGGLLPGSQAAAWSNGTYNYPDTVVTPYEDHVACIWWHPAVKDGRVLWSVFDGCRWSPPGKVCSAPPIDSAFRSTLSAVTVGPNEVFFTASGLSSVYRWDGESWVAELIELDDGGMLSLAGDALTLFTCDLGKVTRLWRNWAGRSYSRRAMLRYYRRSATGQWDGPVDLTPEFTIHKYRGLAGFSVPPYSPPNFVPLAWSDHDDGALRLLKIPIPRTR